LGNALKFLEKWLYKRYTSLATTQRESMYTDRQTCTRV
jgi:hypothetical protein